VSAEAAIGSGKKVSESEITGLCDLLMCQLVKLDESKVEGEVKVQKKILVSLSLALSLSGYHGKCTVFGACFTVVEDDNQIYLSFWGHASACNPLDSSSSSSSNVCRCENKKTYLRRVLRFPRRGGCKSTWRRWMG
jgi:hypothetical protein